MVKNVADGTQTALSHPVTESSLIVTGVLTEQPELVAAGTIIGIKNSIKQILNAKTKRENVNAGLQTAGTILGFGAPLAGVGLSAIQYIPTSNLPSGTPGETPSSTYGFKNLDKAFNQSAGTNVPLTNEQKVNIILFGF